MDWKYETFGPDGQCKLFGVNIFDYDWKTTGKRVKAVSYTHLDVYKRQVQRPAGRDHLLRISRLLQH